MSESIITRYGIDTAGAEGTVSKLTQLYEQNATAAEKSQKESATMYQNAARQTSAYQQALQNVRATINSQVQMLKVLEKEYERMAEAQKKTTNPASLKAISDRMAVIKAKLTEIRGETEKVGKAAKGAKADTGGWMDMLKGGAATLAAAFSVDAIKNFIGSIVAVRSEFAKYEAVLKIAYDGNQAFADSAMSMIRDFAATTNFSVAEVTSTFIKMKSAGIEPTTAELTKLADLANSKGKDMDQLVEALLDAQTFEFERLKEFGIKAKQSGDNVEFTFKGIPTTVKKSSAAINDYIMKLGELNGVQGSTAAIAETMGGQLSNLGDSWDSLMNQMGKRGEGFFGKMLTLASEITQQLTRMFTSSSEEIDQQALKYGQAAGEVYKKASEGARKEMRKQAVDEANEAVALLKENLKKQAADKAKYNTSSRADREEEKRLTTIIRTGKAELSAYQKVEYDEREARKKAANAKAEEQKEADAKAAKERIAAAKHYASERKALEKELQSELLDLEKRYNEAKINLLDDSGEAQLQETRRQAMAEIDEMVSEIERLNQQLGKPKDLSTEQQSQVSTLRKSVDKDYMDGLEEITRQRNERLFDLQTESDAKEIEALERKYDEMERMAKGNFEELVAIAAARFRDIEELELRQAQANISRSEELEILGVGAAAVKGPKEDQESFEDAKQKKTLEIQEKYAKQQLALLADKGDKEAVLRKAQLKAQLTDIANAQAALRAKESKFSLAKAFGLSEEEFSIVKEQFEQILGNISQIAAAKVQAAEEAVQAKNKELENAETELDRELQLNKQGFASNVEGKRKEVADLKKERDKALADQKKAQKMQAVVESAQQTISMITATANIFQSLSGLPLGLGVPLGVAAVGTMFAAFIASKTRASGASTKYRTGGRLPGGRVDGPSHDHGGVQGTGAFGDVQVEGGEAITRRASTEKYWPLLQAINEDTPTVWQQKSGSIARLLEGTGVTLTLPDREETMLVTSLPEQVRVAEKADGLGEIRAELKLANTKLAALEGIKSNTSRIPRRTYTPLPDGRVVVQEGNNITTLSQ